MAEPVSGVVAAGMARLRAPLLLQVLHQPHLVVAAVAQGVLTPQQEQPVVLAIKVCLLYWNFYHETLYN
jgi:hypothetical protein